MRYKLMRNRVIATKSGHAIEFKKGEYVHVPPAAEAEILAAGGVPETEEDEPAAPKPLTPDERKQMLLLAIEEIVTRNDPSEFTSGGTPHHKVVSEKTGIKVDQTEMKALWVEFREARKAE
jgi:hypothetical protein